MTEWTNGKCRFDAHGYATGGWLVNVRCLRGSGAEEFGPYQTEQQAREAGERWCRENC